MNSYIVIAVVAYLGFAVNAVIDKFLLRKAIPDGSTYAFYIGLLSGLAIFLAPFGFAVPAARIIGIALISGAAFIYALIFFFESLKRADASVVLPAIGGMVPLVTLAVSGFFDAEIPSGTSLVGVGCLVAGTFLLSNNPASAQRGWLKYAIPAAALFSLSFTLSKLVYSDQVFISGLIWTRFGCLLASASIMLMPRARANIFATSHSASVGSGILFFSGQIIAAFAGILQNLSVSMGNVTIVNALQGTQFAFLFLITAGLYRFFPRILKEDFSRPVVMRKAIAVGVIAAGLVLIV